MVPQFTDAVVQALEAAVRYAEEHRHTEINENHLLWALLSDSQGYFSTLASSFGLDPASLQGQLEKTLEKTAKYTGEPQRKKEQARNAPFSRRRSRARLGL